MTISELTGKRNLDFSGWIRHNCPDSKIGFLVSDLDFILSNYRTKKLMLLEAKSHNGKMKEWQKYLFMNLEEWIKLGIANDNKGWTFLGFHSLTFENNSPDNGRCWFDGKETSELELIKLLTF